MKSKTAHLFILVSVCFLSLVDPALAQESRGSALRLKLGTVKSTYMLGEPIEFTFELSNRRKEPVSFPGIFAVGEGFLHVQVSKDGKEFLGCDNEGWGLLDLIDAKTVVTAEQPALSNSSVLWNYISQDKMQFRFKEPGVYYFRSLFSLKADDDQAATKLESKAIKIELKAPTGDDLIVWNKIKNDGNFAYFIHTKEIPIPTYKPEERARFQARVEQIIADHPHSFYTALLRPGIEKIKGKSAQIPTGYKVEIKLPSMLKYQANEAERHRIEEKFRINQ